MRKHNMWKIFTFVIAIMFCIITGLEVVNAYSPVLVKAEELEKSYKKDDTVSYTINLKNADKKVFSALVFEIEYDKTKLKYTHSLLDENFMVEGFKSIDGPDSAAGTVSFVISQLELNPVVIEESAVVVLNFKALKDIDASESIKINNLEVANDPTGDNDLINLDVTTKEIPVDMSSVKLEKSSYEFDLSGTKTGKIKVNYAPENTTDLKKFTFTSSNNNVVTVDNEGNLEAKGIGTATITVNAFGKTMTATVKALFPLTGAEINKTSVSLEKGTTTDLKVSFKPDKAFTDDITWTSSDSNVAEITVDSDDPTKATVTAKNGGNATITVNVGGFKVTTTVEVTVPVSSFEVSNNNVTLKPGDSETITATITPIDATDKDITWEVKDSTIATVRKEGNKLIITGKKTGSTQVVGTLSDGKKVTINVKVMIPMTGITLSESKVNFDLNSDDTEKTIGLTINPSDTTEDKTAVWKSANEKVATVDATGHIVAKGIGSTTITVTVGNFTKEITVTVTAPITSFTLEQTTAKVLRKSTIKLIPTINPEVTSDDKTITWTSSDPSIATVDNTGTVKGVKKGTVTITGTLRNGMTVKCVVTVETIEAEKIYFDTTELSIARTHNQTLKFNFYPLNATETDGAVWTSDNEEVATVDKSGNIKTLKNGIANITVTITNADKSVVTATVKVVVNDIKLKGFTVKNDGNLKVGDSINIELVKDPLDATEEVTFTYKSLNEEIVKVDANGKVTAVGVGSTTIEITSSNGTKFTYSVKVEGKESPVTEAKSAVMYGISAITCLVGMLLAVIKLKKC